MNLISFERLKMKNVTGGLRKKIAKSRGHLESATEHAFKKLNVA